MCFVEESLVSFSDGYPQHFSAARQVIVVGGRVDDDPSDVGREAGRHQMSGGGGGPAVHKHLLCAGIVLGTSPPCFTVEISRAQAGPGLCSFLGFGGATPVAASVCQAVSGNDLPLPGEVIVGQVWLLLLLFPFPGTFKAVCSRW